MNKFTQITLKIALYLVFMIAISSCMKSSISGNQQYSSQTRATSTFHEVILEGYVRAEISQADTTSVIIHAESNLAPYIYTEVSGDKLFVGIQSNVNLDPNYEIIVEINSPNIEKAIIEGSGDIWLDSIISDELYVYVSGSGNVDGEVACKQLITEIDGSGDVDLHVDAEQIIGDIEGSGDIYLDGESNHVEAFISGSGNFDGYHLRTTNALGLIEGSGTIYVYASESLDASIKGSGNILYRGTPKISIDVQGSGKVQQIH